LGQPLGVAENQGHARAPLGPRQLHLLQLRVRLLQ
jgi:hypothetical protein